MCVCVCLCVVCVLCVCVFCVCVFCVCVCVRVCVCVCVHTVMENQLVTAVHAHFLEFLDLTVLHYVIICNDLAILKMNDPKS